MARWQGQTGSDYPASANKLKRDTPYKRTYEEFSETEYSDQDPYKQLKQSRIKDYFQVVRPCCKESAHEEPSVEFSFGPCCQQDFVECSLHPWNLTTSDSEEEDDASSPSLEVSSPPLVYSPTDHEPTHEVHTSEELSFSFPSLRATSTPEPLPCTAAPYTCTADSFSFTPQHLLSYDHLHMDISAEDDLPTPSFPRPETFEKLFHSETSHTLQLQSLRCCDGDIDDDVDAMYTDVDASCAEMLCELSRSARVDVASSPDNQNTSSCAASPSDSLSDLEFDRELLALLEADADSYLDDQPVHMDTHTEVDAL